MTVAMGVMMRMAVIVAWEWGGTIPKCYIITFGKSIGVGLKAAQAICDLTKASPANSPTIDNTTDPST